MANSFLTPGKIGAAFKPKPLKLGPTQPVRSRFGSQISQQQRRITGVSRKLVQAYQESPARMLPISRELKVKRPSGGLARLAGR